MTGVFTSADNVVGKGKKDSRYGKAITWLDDIPDDKYAEGAVINKMEGTVVPHHSEHGGIKGSSNVFGLVQGGIISTPGPDGRIIQIGQVDVTPIWKNAQKPLPEELKPVSKKQAKHEKELQQISTQAEKEDDLGEVVLSASSFTLTPPEEEEAIPFIKKFIPPKTLVIAILKGGFGTFKGEYRYIYTTENYVILVADADSSVYTPPANKESLSISCPDGEFVVYFVGIEFSLPFANAVVQLFIRAGE